MTFPVNTIFLIGIGVVFVFGKFKYNWTLSALWKRLYPYSTFAPDHVRREAWRAIGFQVAFPSPFEQLVNQFLERYPLCKTIIDILFGMSVLLFSGLLVIFILQEELHFIHITDSFLVHRNGGVKNT